jgi:uncharacterized coiled-coil DUF342 family protein
MTNEDLAQIRVLMREEITGAVAPLSAKLDHLDAKVDRMDAKLDRVIDRADDILTGVVRLRTDAENRDAGIRQ